MPIDTTDDLVVGQLDIDDTDGAMLIASAADVRTRIKSHAAFTLCVSVLKPILSSNHVVAGEIYGIPSNFKKCSSHATICVANRIIQGR